MKLKFVEAPKGRHYKVGEVVDFTGPVAEGYARKYMDRGWAVEHKDEPKPQPVADKPKAAEPAKPTLGLPQANAGKK